MSLEEIICNLNENNINNIYFEIKKSQDIKCKQIIIEISNGKNLFEILHQYIPSSYGFLLDKKNPQNLIILSRILNNKRNIDHKFSNILFFPILLIFFVLLSTALVNFIMPIGFSFFVFLITTLVLINYYFYRLLKNQFVFLVQMEIVKLFLENKIEQQEFLQISKGLSLSDYEDFSNYTSYQEIIYAHTSKQVENFSQFLNIYDHENQNFQDFCQQKYTQIIMINLFFLVGYSCFIFVYFVWSLIKI